MRAEPSDGAATRSGATQSGRPSLTDTAWRYVRLYVHFVRFSLSRALEFRVDFVFRIVMDTAFYGVNLAFFQVLFGHVEGLGGLDLDQVYVFVASYLLVDAIDMTIFSDNLWELPDLINRGDLDYYLVRPASTLFFVSLRELSANSSVNLLVAAGLLAWALGRYPEPLGAGAIALHLALLGVSALLYWMLYTLSVLPTFWLHRGEGLRQLWFSLRRFGERPHRIYRGWLGRLFVSVLPIGLIASYPTYLLLEGWTVATLLPMVLVPVALFLVVLAVWGRGLRAYASASS